MKRWSLTYGSFLIKDTQDDIAGGDGRLKS